MTITARPAGGATATTATLRGTRGGAGMAMATRAGMVTMVDMAMATMADMVMATMADMAMATTITVDPSRST